MISLELHPEIERLLGEFASESGMPLDQYASRVLIEHCEDMEDARIAERRLAESDGKTYSLEEVMARLKADEKNGRKAGHAAE